MPETAFGHPEHTQMELSTKHYHLAEHPVHLMVMDTWALQIQWIPNGSTRLGVFTMYAVTLWVCMPDTRQVRDRYVAQK